MCVSEKNLVGPEVGSDRSSKSLATKQYVKCKLWEEGKIVGVKAKRK